jgi:hypothetical protein
MVNAVLGSNIMTNSVTKIVERLRSAGFDINPVSNPVSQSHLWQVSGRGQMSTGQLIDLSSKLANNR